MFIIVDLQDHENKSHNSVKLEVEAQTTIQELQALIYTRFHIELTYQDILSGDKRIDLCFGSLHENGVEDTSILVLKHDSLPNWEAMLAYVQDARQAKSVDNVCRITSSVDAALTHLKLLTAANFFTTYPKFNLTLLAFKNDFSHYLDSDNKHIKFACEEYFSKLFGDNAGCPTIVVNCEEKERSGIQGGLIANVSQGESALGRYHVKVHIGLAVYPFNENADLREILAYKLLQLIGIGPTVHFVPNIHYSALGLYIATEEVVGFRQANEVDMTDEQMSERELIRRILVLKDLHSANYGVNSKGKLSIIDFKVGDNYGKAEKYWVGEDKTERQRVARVCFESWCLEPMLVQANNDIFHQKELFRMNGIRYKPSRNFEVYLAEIRKNINYISSFL